MRKRPPAEIRKPRTLANKLRKQAKEKKRIEKIQVGAELRREKRPERRAIKRKLNQ